MLRFLLLASGLLLLPVPGNAQHVYVWRDTEGVMNYSDAPPVGAEVGHVRKFRVRSLTAVERSGGEPSSSTESRDEVRGAGSIASSSTRDRLRSEAGRDISAGGTYGGGDRVLAGGSGGGDASSVGGSGTEAGAQPLAAGSGPTPGPTTTASGGPNTAVPVSSTPAPDAAVPVATAPAPDRAVPISTSPAPDRAVPVSTAPAADRAVPISTAPAPDEAVPVSSTPVTTSSATTASSTTTSTSSGSPSSSTSSQTAGGSGNTGQATLYWDAVTKPPISKIPVAGYRVYFGEGPGAYLQPRGQGVDAGNVTSYTVQGLKDGTRYYFTVTTYVGGSESPYANEVSMVVAAP